LLCVPGLTRNARDFDALTERLAGTRRIIVAELRGRGQSAYAKDAMTYLPPVYLQDLLALMARLGNPRVVMIGTSLGGLLAMMLAVAARPLLAGVLLNDIGPVLEPAGLRRIRSYVGHGTNWPTWLHAARAIAETHGDAYPDYQLADWTAMAHRLCRLTEQGRIVADYDVRVAEPFRIDAGNATATLWPTLMALAGMPSLLVRGALSDIVSVATATEMTRLLPDMDLVTVPRIGHAPTLAEPESAAAIDRLLRRIDDA
jgi:pimeloyl-ACP methyl ester carboxylesterase